LIHETVIFFSAGYIYERVFNMVLEWTAKYFSLHSIEGLASVMKTNVNYAPLTWAFLINSYQTTRRHIPEPSAHHTAVRASNPGYTIIVVCNKRSRNLSIIKLLKISLPGVSKWRHIASLPVLSKLHQIASLSVKISKLKPNK